MKKCNVCGKQISEFSEKCPYCNNMVNYEGNIEAKKKVYYQNNIVKKACINIVISIVFFVVISFYLSTLFDYLFMILFMVFEVLYITRNKEALISKNKKFLIFSISTVIISTLLAFLIRFNHYGIFDYLFGYGNFETFQKQVLFTLPYVLKFGMLITVLLLDIRAIICSKKKD